MTRRQFLARAAAFGAGFWLVPPAWSNRTLAPRIVVIGGGWGGLTAARYLHEVLPHAAITLLDRHARFWSCPLSNHWLVGRLDGALLSHDYRAAAHHWSYRFVQDEVVAIDRSQRQVVTPGERFPYDWLVLAAGIRHDYAAWFGDDHETAAYARQHFPAAYTPGPEFPQLRDKLQAFAGGDLLMTIPPQPLRCPPAPYERAVMIASWLEQRQVPGRLVILDANPPFQAFQRAFQEAFPKRIVYHAQTRIVRVDPRQRVVESEFDQFSFADAILMPPQQAAELAWQADLIGRNANDQPTGWAAVEPLSFAAQQDERIFIVGDMIDRVSALFGHYPKSGQMASRQGRIVAYQIAARAAGTVPPQALPDSICHLTTQVDPPAALRIAASYRLRGDGEIVQQMKSERDPQPRGEDLAWAQGMFREFLAPQ
ncbi:FAD-dependent oxidoreductase [Rhodocyclaceae bacterium]